MRQPLSPIRAHHRWMGAVLALVLGVTLVITSGHRHDARANGDACVICTAAQTPAVSALAAPAAAAPVATADRSQPAPFAYHSRPVPGRATSRAPPRG